jgi:hypothetical protein
MNSLNQSDCCCTTEAGMKPSPYVYQTIRVPINQVPGYHESVGGHPMASEPSLEELIEVYAGRDGWDFYQLSAAVGSTAGGFDEPKDFAILVFRRDREE